MRVCVEGGLRHSRLNEEQKLSPVVHCSAPPASSAVAPEAALGKHLTGCLPSHYLPSASLVRGDTHLGNRRLGLCRAQWSCVEGEGAGTERGPRDWASPHDCDVHLPFRPRG